MAASMLAAAATIGGGESPPRLFRPSLGAQDGVVADETPFGAWLWVPDDPDESDAAVEAPAEVLAVWRYARALGCDWVLLDSDTDPIAELPTFDWP